MAPLTYTVNDIITDAFIEIGACAPGEQPSADEAQWGLRKLNYLTDEWAAREFFVYGYNFLVATMVANLSPHLIGPAASTPTPGFSTGEQPRPVKIESAAQLQNTGAQTVDLPIAIRDADWWAAQQTKSILTNVVTDLYYDSSSPLGNIYFWPVPNAAAQVRLQLWTTVSQFETIQDPIGGPGGPGTLPQAYRAALMLTLAERLLPSSNIEEHPALAAAALMVRKAVFGNNITSPRISTQDAGMPRAGRAGGGVRGDFNWMTGGAPGGRPE